MCRSIKQSGDLFLCYMTVSKVMWSKYRTDESSGIDSSVPVRYVSGNYDFLLYKVFIVSLLKG